MRNKNYYIYILTNKGNTVLYTGVTNNLFRRIEEHKQKTVSGLTKNYNIYKLVYYEITNSIEVALNREKQIKNWKRQWKIDLIEKSNKEWKDLASEIY